jgi:hypothetical protein
MQQWQLYRYLLIALPETSHKQPKVRAESTISTASRNIRTVLFVVRSRLIRDNFVSSV